MRILTVCSKTLYNVDKGVQRGLSYEMGRLFVDDPNKKLAKDKKGKQKHLKVGDITQVEPNINAGIKYMRCR